MLRVNEVFLSLQGEGVNQGLPTVFVRLQGCNLSPGCSYCDTVYARPRGGKEMDSQEIVDRIVMLSPSTFTRVCLTGGEPLLQETELGVLVAKLNKFNYYIECFTNGTLPKPSWWTRVHSWVVDIKAPSSGTFSSCYETWCNSRGTDQVKLTVGTRGDLDFASRTIAYCATYSPQVIVSPVILFRGQKDDPDYIPWDFEWLQTVARFCIDKGVRFSLQWHKVVWGNRRGV